jgi:hypothetical protein
MKKYLSIKVFWIIPILAMFLASCRNLENNSQNKTITFSIAKEYSQACSELVNDDVLLEIKPIEVSFSQSYNDAIVEYLNNGGNLLMLQQQLEKLMHWFTVEAIDVTNDSIPEVIIRANWTYIIECKNGKYKSLLQVEPYDLVYNYSPSVQTNEDLNNNGIPEIIIIKQFGGPSPINVVEILEWNGKVFDNIVTIDNICISHGIDTCIRDGIIYIKHGSVDYKRIDNGTKEICITDGLNLVNDPFDDNDIPINIILRWNGKYFAIYFIEYVTKK